MPTATGLVVVSCLASATAFAPPASLPAVQRVATRAPPVVALAKKKTNVDFSDTGSKDADGYRRGSFGIGENESIVIWGIVAAALVFGGGLDEETAQKIGEAQRGFYPKPPGLEQAEAVKAKAAAKAAAPSAFPAS